MNYANKRSFLRILSIFIIYSFFLNLNGIAVCFASSNEHPSDKSTLAPAISINNYDLSKLASTRIIDSYVKQSLLNEFEYYRLKLDVIFNFKVNPAVIEKQLAEFVTNEDLLVYFSTQSKYKARRTKSRLKLTKAFNLLLKKYGIEPYSMPEYQDKIMEKLLERHRYDLKHNGDFIITKRVWELLKFLSPDQMLLFKSQPSSMEEHALKNKIVAWLKRGLEEDGIRVDESTWESVSEAINKKRDDMLGYFNFYVNKHKDEIKRGLLRDFSLKDIAYYFADTSGFNLERQNSRKKIYAYFVRWLKSIDANIKRDPYLAKLYVYNEGDLWEYRYKVKLGQIIKQLLEIDADSYEMSVNKMLAQKISADDNQKVSKVLKIMCDAEKNMLNITSADYDTYHRIRAVNDPAGQRFIYIDENPVIYFGTGIWQTKWIVADDLYLADQGKTVFYKTNNPDTGANEMFIFTQTDPYVSVVYLKNDYSGIFKEYFKKAIADQFSEWKLSVFLDYLSGEVDDWDKAYNIAVEVNAFCERFFTAKFNLGLDPDAWNMIRQVIKEHVAEHNHRLAGAESEMFDIALPFNPALRIMRLNKKRFGVMPLDGHRLLEASSSQLMLNQSI